MVIQLTSALADKADCGVLDRLGYAPSEEQVKNWTHQASTITFTWDRILKTTNECFWSTILFNESFLKSLDSVLDVLPRLYEKDEYHVMFTWGLSLTSVAMQLKETALALFLRTAVYTKTLRTDMTEREYLDAARDRKAVTLRRFSQVCAVFPSARDVLSKVLRRLLDAQVFRAADMAELAREYGKDISDLQSSCSLVLDAFGSSTGPSHLRAAQLVEQLLAASAAALADKTEFLKVCKLAKQGINEFPWTAGVPSLVEAVHGHFPLETLMDIAMVLTSYPLKRILRMKAQVEQFGADLFNEVLSSTTMDEKIQMIMASLTCERFMYVVNERQNISDRLVGCPREQKEYVERAIETICDNQTKETVKQLERMGLLDGLGDLADCDEKVAACVAEISQILPHLSQEYAHLCARHFGYNYAEAVEALLMRDERLPMDLRRVEVASLSKTSNNEPTIPPLSFVNHDLVLSAIPRPKKISAAEASEPAKEEKNAFKGLFSLAPVVKKEEEQSVVTIAGNEPPPVTDVMLKLREALDRLKVRAANGEHQKVQEGPNGERLVPMATARRYAGVEKFKTTAADKVAIRPFYEKFKYETQFDDMYNDEYDDGYEQKEFQVEPLNEDLPSSSDEEESPTPEAAGGSGKVAPPPPGFSQNRGGQKGRGGPGNSSRGGYTGSGGRDGSKQHTNNDKNSQQARRNQQEEEYQAKREQQQMEGAGAVSGAQLAGAPSGNSRGAGAQRGDQYGDGRPRGYQGGRGDRQGGQAPRGYQQGQGAGAPRGNQQEARPPRGGQQGAGPPRENQQRAGPPRGNQQGAGPTRENQHGAGPPKVYQQGQRKENVVVEEPPARVERQASEESEDNGEDRGQQGGRGARTTTYTGGRDRQMKERHKNAFKQRGADRKMRGAF